MRLVNEKEIERKSEIGRNEKKIINKAHPKYKLMVQRFSHKIVHSDPLELKKKKRIFLI